MKSLHCHPTKPSRTSDSSALTESPGPAPATSSLILETKVYLSTTQQSPWDFLGKAHELLNFSSMPDKASDNAPTQPPSTLLWAGCVSRTAELLPPHSSGPLFISFQSKQNKSCQELISPDHNSRQSSNTTHFSCCWEIWRGWGKAGVATTHSTGCGCCVTEAHSAQHLSRVF